MKKLLRRILTVVLVIVTGFILYIWFGPDKKINGFYCIPPDAMYILETDRPVKSWETISNSKIWALLRTHPIFDDISDDAYFLDTLLEDNRALLSLLGESNLIISAHPTGPKEYDFIMAVDLKKGSKIRGIPTIIEKTFTPYGYQVSQHEYGKYTISEVTDASKETLYLSVVQNYLVFTYTGELIKRSLDGVEAAELGNDPMFLQTFKAVREKGIGRLFFNYKMLDKYLSLYLTKTGPAIEDISEILGFSAVDMNLSDNGIGLNGYTNFKPERSLLLASIHNEGKSEIHLPEILSSRTGWFLRYGFGSGESLYESAIEVIREDSTQSSTVLRRLNLLEKTLGISIKKDLFGWMGSEIGIAGYKPITSRSREKEIVLCFRASDPELARERLDHVSEQVRKRSPAKFEEIRYKTYKIRYLDVKDAYRFLFKKLFDQIEKPYYTHIGDYVVFSNNPTSLIAMIEDHERGASLSNTGYFSDFDSELPDRSSIQLYCVPELLYPILIDGFDAETRASLIRDKAYILAFRQVALNWDSDGEQNFYTRLEVQFDTTRLNRNKEETTDVELQNALRQSKEESEFALQLIKDGVFLQYYPDNQTLEIEAEISDGLMDGDYTEYHPNGEKRVTGSYKDGKKSGVWKSYDPSGSLITKTRYHSRR